MKIVFLLFVWGLTAGAVEFERTKCDANFGNTTWYHLTLNEPALNEAYKLLAQHYGATTLTNCFVTFPTVNGKAVHGPRRVVMDAQWYAIKYVGEKEERIFRHEGIMVEYDYVPGQTGMMRDVLGYSVCRTPELCNRLGIPFPVPQPSQKLPDTF